MGAGGGIILMNARELLRIRLAFWEIIAREFNYWGGFSIPDVEISEV